MRDVCVELLLEYVEILVNRVSSNSDGWGFVMELSLRNGLVIMTFFARCRNLAPRNWKYFLKWKCPFLQQNNGYLVLLFMGDMNKYYVNIMLYHALRSLSYGKSVFFRKLHQFGRFAIYYDFVRFIMFYRFKTHSKSWSHELELIC